MVFVPLYLTLLPTATFALPLPIRQRSALPPRFMGRKGERGLVHLEGGISLEARQSVDTSLIPEFGVQAGVDPDGTGNCKGINNANIPCTCPPDRQTFINDLIANVQAGHPTNNPAVTGVTFPSGNDVASAEARFFTATVTLQNLNGAGVGCPQVSTTWAAQIAAIQASGSSDSAEAKAAITAGVPQGSAAPSPAPAPAADAPAPASGSDASSSGSVDVSLIPEFGVQSGVDPDGTGNCKGINGANIPCTCPPDRQTFINDLIANVEAGHATNNPAVTGLTFPSGDDVASAQARFFTATVTLQNLNGPGVGCPQVSTTWAAQIAAIQSSGSASSAEAKAAITAGVPTDSPSATAPAAAAPAPDTGDTNDCDGSSDVDVSLIPQFGVQSGVQPDGTGNCKGINGANIPCTCPPDRQTFINDLIANVEAGHATNNPAVTGLTFPSGDDVASAQARFFTATVTLQNLNGPGVGCPQVSTTWAAQIAAIQSSGSASSAEAQAAINQGVPQ